MCMLFDRELPEPTPPNPPGRTYERKTSGLIRKKIGSTRPFLTRLAWAALQGAIIEAKIQRESAKVLKINQKGKAIEAEIPEGEGTREENPQTVTELLAREFKYAKSLNPNRIAVSAIEKVGSKIVDMILEKR